MAIKGLDKLKKQLSQLAGVHGTKAIEAAGYSLMGFSQKNAPVDSGNLRSSPFVQVTGDGQAELVYPVDYAWYQEEGTSDFEGKHFVQRAEDEHLDDIVKAAANQIKKEIKDAI